MLLLITINSFGEQDHDDFGETHAFSFSSIAIVLLFAVIAILGILIYKYFLKKEKNKAMKLNELAVKSLSQHITKEEITENKYNIVFDKIEQPDDEVIETAKLWLAKGEIDIDEYDKICNILDERRKDM